MKKLLFILFMISYNLFGQTNYRIPQVLIDKGAERVLREKTLHWFGIDYALLKISDPKKLHDGENLKFVFCPAWSTFFDEHYSQKRISKMLHIDSLIDNRSPFQTSNHLQIDEKTFIAPIPYSLSIDSINKHVAQYNLNSGSGIGVTIVLENFNKFDAACIANIVFFDIQTKEILWLTKINGKAGDKGMTAFWGQGLYEVWAYFIAREYDVKRKTINF